MSDPLGAYSDGAVGIGRCGVVDESLATLSVFLVVDF